MLYTTPHSLQTRYVQNVFATIHRSSAHSSQILLSHSWKFNPMQLIKTLYHLRDLIDKLIDNGMNYIYRTKT